MSANICGQFVVVVCDRMAGKKPALWVDLRKGAAHQVGDVFHLGDVERAVIDTRMTVTTFTPLLAFQSFFALLDLGTR